MMPPIVFFTVAMAQGFGVAVVVEQLCRRLMAMGIPVAVGCQEKEGSFGLLNVQKIPARVSAVENFMRQLGSSIAVVQTSPFFELIPELGSNILPFVWENGDPTPEFFTHDRVERRHIVEHKKRLVYPQAAEIIAISEFIKSEIECPHAHVIYLGCDHVPDQGLKNPGDFTGLNRVPLRVGTLMRLGVGESHYKGGRLFIEIQRACEEVGIPVQMEVMGRGTQADAAEFQAAGMKVHLNATDEDRARYLRELDVFISCSQWEGFNLPLVEAQALGTVGMAFDVGAHPEVTPCLVSSVAEIVTLLRRYSENGALLGEHSATAYAFVRSRFEWAKTAAKFMEVIQDYDRITGQRLSEQTTLVPSDDCGRTDGSVST